MRILAAMMKHETNSFSPVRTDLDRFRQWSLRRGDEAIAAYRGTAMPLAAYFELAEARGAGVVCPLTAEAMPSGLVEEAAYEQLVEWLLEPVRAGAVDAAFLDLHGAMTAEHVDDGEGELLRRLRAIAPEMPVAVTLDMHANLTAAMVENADAIIGYKTYPHTDMHAVGRQIAGVLWARIEGRADPVMAWGAAPILAQTIRMGTADEPMRALQQATRAEEARGLLAATVLGGFPMADVPHAGLSVVTVADGDRAAAEAARDRLLARAWEAREGLVYRHRDLRQAIEAARAANARPVILLDHADNVGSGGTADVMTVIGAVLKAGLDGVAAAAVYDPQAAAAMHAAGEGASLTLDLGGKTDMPAIGLKGRPLRLSGRVAKLTDGRWTVQGPMYTGVQVDTGPTAVFETGGMKIVVTSRHHEPWDAGILANNGIDPAACSYILLKSRIHYRAGFQPVQPDLALHLPLDGEGVATSDNRVLEYRRLRRPIFPLDPAEAIGFAPPEP
jgi:microcystin degradation protein MlrC